MKSKAYGNIVETGFRAYETEICLQSQASEKFWDCIADHGRAKEKLWNRKHSRHTNFGHHQPPLDKNSLKLWIYTLLGSGYIEKANRLPNRNYYSLTSKGEDELWYHTRVGKHKMFIQSMT